MGKKAGIFDPWRQEEEQVDPVPQKDGWDESAESKHCVQFQGVRNGINVWLSSDELDESVALKEARSRIVKAVIKLGTALPNVLTLHRIQLGRHEQAGAVRLTDGSAWITISTGEEGDEKDQYAVKLLAAALRYAQSREPVYTREVLTELGIKPFVM